MTPEVPPTTAEWAFMIVGAAALLAVHFFGTYAAVRIADRLRERAGGFKV